MKAWKMVDLEHAEAVAKGSMLIGVLAGYMQAETQRTGKPDGVTTAPGWAYCLSEVGSEFRPQSGVPQAIFEISDVGLLGQFAMTRTGARVYDTLYDVVRYDPAAASAGDAFVKDPMFAAEKEIRLVFRPPQGGQTDGPILIRADYTIAGLMKRIA